MFDPAEVAELKTARMAVAPAAAPLSEGRLAARVFYLFDHGRELREIIEELEVPPSVVVMGTGPAQARSRFGILT